jgi:hypothetical protein
MTAAVPVARTAGAEDLRGAAGFEKASPAVEPPSVIVAPVDKGWSVSVDGVANPMLFRSGRSAEEAGRALAQRLAQHTGAAQLEVRLKGGAVAGRFILRPNDLSTVVKTQTGARRTGATQPLDGSPREAAAQGTDGSAAPAAAKAP